jgi:hypothetical protein
MRKEPGQLAFALLPTLYLRDGLLGVKPQCAGFQILEPERIGVAINVYAYKSAHLGVYLHSLADE